MPSSVPAGIALRRKLILPSWIRFFSWVFLFVGAFIVLITCAAALGVSTHIRFLGFSFLSQDVFSAIGLWVVVLAAMSSVVAYSILWERTWAIRLGLAYGALALTTNLGAFYVQSTRLPNESAMFPLDFILLIPFLFVLARKRVAWENYVPPIIMIHTPGEALEPSGKSGAELQS